MKRIKLVFSILGAIAFFYLVSCSKKDEVILSNEKVILKDIPDLISSRDDYNLLTRIPSFPGTDSLYRIYLYSHLSYPEQATLNNIQGKVFASFIVEENGSLSNIKVIKGIGYGCDDAVVTLLKNMPSWNPGQINGNNVRVAFVLPVSFKLNN